MGVTMMKTAYSPIFNESLDFSCVIFDPHGQMLAQAEFCPSQIGTIKFTVDVDDRRARLDAFEPGDVVIHNDPYRGSGHVPEHMMLKPVFYKGELFAFVANVAHMSESGAKTPGGLSGDATEVFQEGLLLPPVQDQAARRGRRRHLEDHARRTTARRKVTFGDFRAMMASLDLAERRMHDADRRLRRRHGPRRDGANCWRVAERRMRAEIAAIPNGVYTLRGRDRGRRHHRPRLPDAAAL